MKKIILTGNVGNDPQLRDTQDGKKFVTFSFAVFAGTRDAPKTDWVDITVNGIKIAPVMEHVKKGSKLMIIGYPSAKLLSRKDGTHDARMSVSMHEFEFIGNKKDTEYATEMDSTETHGLASDVIPF